MCCFTHSYVTPETTPPDPKMHCQCGVGQPDDGGNDPDSTMFNTGFGPCQRMATQEDLLCDTCSGRDGGENPSTSFLGMASSGLEESGMGEYLRKAAQDILRQYEVPEVNPQQWAREPTKLTYDIPVQPVPGEPGKFMAYGADAEELIRRIKKIPPE